MRPIDAAVKDLEMIGDCRTCGNKTPFCDSNPDSCNGYKWRGVPFAATDDSRPLTLEELREMDGEPVWCVSNAYGIVRINCWTIVSVDLERCAGNTVWLNFEDYGIWLAYRHKPSV